MKKILTILPVVAALTLSCEDYELTKSIFISDPENPDLPAYTEWGYNTFGVLIDREPFINDETGVPAKIINTDGITTFELIGNLEGSGYQNYYSDKIIFVIPDITPHTLTDLMVLDDVTINLEDPDCRVFFNQNDGEKELQILNGTLQFRRAQNLIVDKDPAFVILSGTFQFQALMDNTPVSFASGRFDISFNQDNFFYY